MLNSTWKNNLVALQILLFMLAAVLLLLKFCIFNAISACKCTREAFIWATVPAELSAPWSTPSGLHDQWIVDVDLKGMISFECPDWSGPTCFQQWGRLNNLLSVWMRMQRVCKFSYCVFSSVLVWTEITAEQVLKMGKQVELRHANYWK